MMTMVFLDSIFNPILQPLLRQGVFLTVVVLAFVIMLVSTLIYKYFTDQKEMKQLKDEQKEYQKRIKSLRDKPEEAMKLQKEAMSKNFTYMKHSFKATLITFIPIILIFGWMGGHLSYEPIKVAVPYTLTVSFGKGITGNAQLVVPKGTEVLGAATQPITSEVAWRLQSSGEGEQALTVKVGKEQQTKTVVVAKDLKYVEPVSVYDKNAAITQMRVDYPELLPLGRDFTIFGWHPGWLGLYIIFSLVFSLILRKVLRVY